MTPIREKKSSRARLLAGWNFQNHHALPEKGRGFFYNLLDLLVISRWHEVKVVLSIVPV